MTRAARDERGRTVQVPRSMTYGEWKKQFVKPAVTQGKPAKAQGGPAKAKGVQKTSKPVQGSKTQRGPAVGQGGWNPAQSKVQPVQKTNKSAQDPAADPAVSKTETVRMKDPGTQAPKNPYGPQSIESVALTFDGNPQDAFEDIQADIEAYRSSDDPEERARILTRRFEAIKRVSMPYSVERGGSIRAPYGDFTLLSRMTNDLVSSGRFTVESQDAVFRYTVDSDYINRMLYDTDNYASLLAASGIPPESLTLGADDIRLIDEAISLGKTEEPMIVFRGLTDSPLGIPLERITDRLVEEGFEWTTEGFESCSLNPRRADAFGKELRMCYIVPPSEGVGIYIGEGTYRSDGHSLSDISGQKEFLTARNIRKKVIKVKNIGPGRKEVTAVIIPPTGRYNGPREMETHHSG